jgi:TRAP-type C4-dicarboxylate transport system permease small subunit
MRNDSIQWPALLAKGIIDAAMFSANLCMAGMIVLVCINVFLRYLFGRPLYWGDEIMIYLMILTVFLGFGHMLIENRHVRMTALVERTTVRTQNILWVFTSLLSIGYFIFLLAAAVYMTKDSFQTGFFSTVTGLPIGPWQVVICIGLGILVMASVWFTGKRVKMALAVQNEQQDQQKRDLCDMIE